MAPAKRTRKKRKPKPKPAAAIPLKRAQIQKIEKGLNDGLALAAIARDAKTTTKTIRKYFAGQVAEWRKRPKPGANATPIRIYTNEERALVGLLLGISTPANLVASKMGISPATFALEFAEEIRVAREDMQAAVTATIYELALKGSERLLMFIARSRYQWDDRVQAPPPPPDPGEPLRNALEGLSPKGREAARILAKEMGGRSKLDPTPPAPGDTTH